LRAEARRCPFGSWASKIDFSMGQSIDILMPSHINESIMLRYTMTFGQRIKAAREHAVPKLSQGQLAKKLGLQQPTIHNLETNPKVTSSKHTNSIARITGVRVEWLETGQGKMADVQSRTSVDEPENKKLLTEPEINIHQMRSDVPVLGLASCGEDGLFELNGQILDMVRRPPRLVGAKNVYALYVDGESMSPWREPGQLVYVHPDMPAKIGDYVVVEMEPEKKGDTVRRAYIKRLVRRTSEKLILAQYNPPEEKTLPAKRVRAVHRVIDWSELLGI